MTTTAIKAKKTKSAPFQSKTKPGRSLSPTIASAPLPALSFSKQECLSDWDHSS